MNAEIALALRTPNNLMPANPSKDTKSRINKYNDWMNETGRNWHSPDLAAYRDHLLKSISPASTSAHLSTIRGQYARIIRDNETRTALYEIAEGISENGADRKAFVDETITRLENATNPKSAPVKVTVIQDREDSSELRLTKAQAESLTNAPDAHTIKGLRDTAIIAMLLCTGIRETELCDLDVNDLRQELGGELALRIRKGKGNKQRLIPYGDLDWSLVIVDKWMTAVGITEGAVFRGMFKGGGLRDGRLTARAVQYMIASYPIAVSGAMVSVKPHDLRRTYAVRLYKAGVDRLAIRDNLGHASVKTTEKYIGVQTASERRAPAVFDFDLSSLNGW